MTRSTRFAFAISLLFVTSTLAAQQGTVRTLTRSFFPMGGCGVALGARRDTC